MTLGFLSTPALVARFGCVRSMVGIELMSLPFFIALAAWWPEPSGDRDHHRASWEYAGWDLTLVACGAGLATLTGLYAAFGVIP